MVVDALIKRGHQISPIAEDRADAVHFFDFVFVRRGASEPIVAGMRGIVENKLGAVAIAVERRQ